MENDEFLQADDIPKFVKPPPKPAEETIYFNAYNSHLQLITSWARILDESVEQTKVETVGSGILEHLLEQVKEVQTYLETIIGELIPLRHEAKLLPEERSLDNVLRKLKLTLK